MGLKEGSEKLTILLLEVNGSLYVCAHMLSCQREPSRTLSALPSTFCIDENQHNTQGAFGCALTLEQTILLELEKNFNLLVLLFCFGFYLYSALQLFGDPG